MGVSANVFDAYDALGRPTQYHQRFWVNGGWGDSFNIARTYDYAGHLVTQTNPSGHTQTFAYDIAGRMNNYSGTLGDGVARTYSTGISYSEFGGLQQEQFGTQTALYHKLHYNPRGQLYDIRLSTYSLQTSEFDWNRGCLAFYYTSDYSWGGSNSSNNGNVALQQHFTPADESYSNYSYTQDYYSYDSLNRLSSTSELHGGPWGSSGWDYSQVYNYDRWGNRTVDQNQTTSNVPRPAYTIDTNTNRLIAPSGYNYGYDAAGNQTNDNYTGEGARTFDAENHIKQAWANNQWQTYTYDADGHRIKRVVNGVETWQVYGLGGELLAEYKSGAAVFLPAKEYGYRGGELLVTMSSGNDARLSRFVTNLYYGALQRDPTSTELQNGINQLATAGAQGYSQLLSTASSMARGLLTQTGYETSPYRSDIQYVADLYYTYLQRGPDDSGLNWWAGQVPGSGRTNICNAFEGSSEFQTIVSTLYGTATSDNQRTEQLVNNFYLGAYGRNATSTELQTQRDALNAAAAQGLAQVQAQVESFGRSLFASQVSDYSISDQQFVTNLYEAFLQRGPDTGGLNFWTSIARGGNRQGVLNAFAPCGPARDLAGTLYREEFWLVNDRLGTPRMIVDKSGSLASVKRHDYLPFGEELYANIGGRTTTQGYTGDSTREKFTGYEYDAETGLNFAQARYQSSVQGRFTSVDPIMASASVASPQSLNRYSYVQNNPTNATDPSGMMEVDASMGWGDVAGMWEGGGDSHFGAFENGRSIIAGREAERDVAVGDSIFANRLNDLIGSGDLTRGEVGAIIKGNHNLSIKETSEPQEFHGTPGPGANATPQSAAGGKRNSVVITYSDGTREIRSGGSRAWRNNNPGNIRSNTTLPGKIGKAGGFAIFSDEATGQSNIVGNLRREEYQVLTVFGAIHTWAPPDDGNDTAAYQQHVEALTGLPGATPMNTLNDDQLRSMADAIRNIEGWVPGTVTYRRQ